MKSTPWLNSSHPWRVGLMTTTGLSLCVVVASLLWRTGYAEWAFLLVFVALWAFISFIWSNDHFIEQSGSVLAGIIDHNFRQLHDRMEFLEQELQRVQDQRGDQARKAA